MSKRTSNAPASTGAPLCFVDGSGGGFAVLAASVARSMSKEAFASTTAKQIAVPAEIATVLREIHAPVVEVERSAPAGARRIDLDGWKLSLYEGESPEGDLEKLAVARIARDRIARRLELGEPG